MCVAACALHTHILYIKGVISTGDGDMQFEFDLLNRISLKCVAVVSICQKPDEGKEKLIKWLIDHLVHLVTQPSQ